MSSPTTSPKRALIYTRISRDSTGEQAGVMRQEKDCRLLCELKHWDVVEVMSDNSISAYGDKVRPQWEKALLAIEAGEVDVVVCYHIDRLTRNMQDLERLILLAEKTGVGITTVTGDVDLTTDMGRMIARILAAVARQEVERKGARQKRANQERASNGQPWQSGWRSFGYELDMKQIPSETQVIVKAARDVLGGASLKSIARLWNELGVSTPRNALGQNGWTHNGVKAVLLNPRIAGLNTYRGEVVGVGEWSPILSENIHHQLVALLNDPSRLMRTTGSSGRTPQNLLTGIARCEKCGDTVVAGTSNGKPVYKCKGEHVTTPRAEADNFVRNYLSVAATMTLPGTVFDIPPADNVDEVWEEIQTLQERRTTVTDAYAEGSLSDLEWKRAVDAINTEIQKHERVLAAQSEGLGRDVSALQADAVEKFLTMDLAGQRSVLMRLSEITLHSRNRKRNVRMSQQVSLFVRVADEADRKRMMPVVAEHAAARAAQKEQRSIWTSPLPKLEQPYVGRWRSRGVSYDQGGVRKDQHAEQVQGPTSSRSKAAKTSPEPGATRKQR